MYKALYSTYCGEIKVKGREITLEVIVVPEFGCEFTKFSTECLYWYSEHCGKQEEESSDEKEIFIDPDTKWFLFINENCFWQMYVREYDVIIETPFGTDLDGILNYKIERVQKEYRRRKKEEKRLYFYDAFKNRLEEYHIGTAVYNDESEYQYCLNRCTQVAIDNRFSKPQQSCFILGRIRKTVIMKKGRRKGNLLDFIEPIAKFAFDFDTARVPLFEDEKEELGNPLFYLLEFSSRKYETEGIEATRIKNKCQKSVKDFIKEVKAALEAGDVKKLSSLYEVVFKPQDCSNEKFQILKDYLEPHEDDLQPYKEGEEIWGSDAKHRLWIRFKNGEEDYREAGWIYENISKCTNKSATYFKEYGYNFY